MKKRWVSFFGACALSAMSFAASATQTYSFTYGTHAASAVFDINYSVAHPPQLTITLSNTSEFDALIPTDILTAIFFNVTGDPTLGRVSVVANGSTYLNGVVYNVANTAVGGEWGYANSLPVANTFGANTGVSSTGLGLFGVSSVFPGTNLAGPADPDGLQYGITSAGDNVATGNSPLMTNQLTKNSVTITLDTLPSQFALSSISTVTFLYGTSLTDFHYTTGGGPGTGGPGGNIPEPETLALLGVGLFVAELNRRRRRG